MKKTAAAHPGKLTYLELGIVMGLALGLPAMTVGGKLAKEIGPNAALTSIGIGNFILWLMGIGMIAMTHGSNNAIQNVKDHLGKYTAIFAALVLSCSFLGWYTVQIQGALDGISPAFSGGIKWQFGIVLGLGVTLFSLGGLKLIKIVCLICFPLIFGFVLYSIFTTSWPSFNQGWPISIKGILTIILMWLPCTINLPTFFRYSRSNPDSILGVSVISLLHTFFQIYTIVIGVDLPIHFLSHYSNMVLFIPLAFTLISFLCINLVNIYFATAAWEMVFPKKMNYKAYLSIGLLGTLAYLVLSEFTFQYAIPFPTELLEIMLACYIANLGIVLVLDFMSKMLIGTQTDFRRRVRGSICWIVGCFIVSLNLLYSADATYSLLIGILVSFFSYLLSIFIETTMWSANKLRNPT